MCLKDLRPMVDPISLTIFAKIVIILKQYAILIPMTRKGLFQLIRESREAKAIEVARVRSLKEYVPAGAWYLYTILRYLVEFGFYAVLLHSIFGVHTLGAALLFCLEDWLLYWITIFVPFAFASHWEKRIGASSRHPRFIDLMVDPAVAVEREVVPILRNDET